MTKDNLYRDFLDKTDLSATLETLIEQLGEENKPRAIFCDSVRLALLEKYGGLYLDLTTIMSRKNGEKLEKLWASFWEPNVNSRFTLKDLLSKLLRKIHPSLEKLNKKVFQSHMIHEFLQHANLATDIDLKYLDDKNLGLLLEIVYNMSNKDDVDKKERT